MADVCHFMLMNWCRDATPHWATGSRSGSNMHAILPVLWLPNAQIPYVYLSVCPSSAAVKVQQSDTSDNEMVCHDEILHRASQLTFPILANSLYLMYCMCLILPS